MQVKNYRTLSATAYPNVEGVLIRHIRDLRGKMVRNVELRVFEIQPGASTVSHTHPHSHDVLILHGTGMVQKENNQQSVEKGDVVSIAGNEPHSFSNNGTEVLEFICLDCQVADTGG